MATLGPSHRTAISPSKRRTRRTPREMCRLPAQYFFQEHFTTVATKIRLMRLGKIRSPQYRIVVADSRTKRDGKVIESIGQYRPKEQPSFINLDSDRVQYWLSVGAQPTEPVLVLLKLTGDWQKFKGEPGTENRVKVAEPKQSRLDRAQGAATRVMELKAVEEKAKADKKKAKKDDGEKAETAKAGKGSKSAKAESSKDKSAKAEAPKDEASKAEAPKAEAGKE